MRKLAKAAGVLHTPDTMKKPALLCLFAALFFAVPVSAQGIDDVAADVDGSSDNSGNNDKNNAEDEDEESRKLRTLLAFLIGMQGGPEGEGMPRDVFRVAMDLLMPSWDAFRRGVVGDGGKVRSG